MEKMGWFRWEPVKFSFLMKLATFSFALVCGMTLSVLAVNPSDAQELLEKKISVKIHGLALEDALREIARVSGVKFNYTNEVSRNKTKIQLDVQAKPLREVLEQTLSPLFYSFNTVGSRILIRYEPGKRPEKKIQPESLQRSLPGATVLTVKGQVKDERNEGIPGVNVQVKGSQRGTITDKEGGYEISDVEEKSILVFSFVGYETWEEEVRGRSVIDIQLKPSLSRLEEVVVVGYASKLKSDITGAVSAIDSKVLENRPINNLSQGLQGLLPNLNVSISSGTPGESASLNVRGYTSINSGGPLVLVDGVQMDIDAVNPNDVESISVLKDAASAAIYGARGAFGVILITTKSGKYEENARVSYSNNFQFRKPTVIPKLMNSVDFAEAVNTAVYNDNKTFMFNEEQLQWIHDYFNDPLNAPVFHNLPNGNFLWHGNGNGFDEIVRSWSPTKRHDLTFSGGSRKTSLYASLGYMDQEGMFKVGNDKLKRYNATIKARTQVADAINIGFQTLFTQTNYNEPFEYTGKGSYWHAIMRDDPLSPLYTPDYAPVGGGLLTGRYANYLEVGARDITNDLTTLLKLDLDYKVAKGLHLKTDLSYRYGSIGNKQNRLLVQRYQNNWSVPQTTHSLPTFIRRATSQTDYLAYNLYADYALSLKQKHAVNLLAGFNQEYSKSVAFNAQVNDLLNESVPAFRTASGEDVVGDSESEWAIRGVFTRFNYKYDDKYLLEFNGRYDGTSRFPKASRFAFFPSISAGWRLSGEQFMKRFTWLENLMLRASYGSLGNQNVANYAYINSLTYQSQVPYIIGSIRPPGMLPANLVSGNLTWETVTSNNLGVDLNIFGKLRVSADYYIRKTYNMLTAAAKLPATLGASVPQENSASLKTKGWDLEINWNDRFQNGLGYSANFILSDSRAWITKFDGNPNNLTSTYYVGQELGEIWGYETLGIIQTADEVAAMPNQDRLGYTGRWGPGDVRYADLNEDGEINFGNNTLENPGDRKIIGNSRIRYAFGTRFGLTWKGFDLNIFFQGIGKQQYVPGDMIYWGKNLDATGTPTYYIYENSWTPENTGAYYPVYKRNSNHNLLAQTRYLENLAYVRLKNFTLGYTPPASLLKAVRIDGLRLYVSGENLWEATKMRHPDFDPEGTSSNGKIYPFQRTLSFGLQLNL